MNLNNTPLSQTPGPETEAHIQRDSLIRRIAAFFAPPVFPEDEDLSRKAAVLNIFLLAVLVISIVVNLANFLGISSPSGSFEVVGLVLLIAIGGLITMRRGAVMLTAKVFLVIIWLFLVVSSSLYGQFINPILPSMVFPILAASLLVSNTAAFVFTGITVIYAVAFYMLTLNNLLPQVLQFDQTNFLMRMVLNFIMMGILVYIYNRISGQALSQARVIREELQSNNQELTEVRQYLEGTVEERTRLLEHRTRYLETASSISSIIISILDMQEMLDTVTEEISNRFDFYHVGIFLLDEKREWAVMRSASSPGGRQMIARGHQLEVGKQGMVGFVTSIGQARISQDVGLDRIHSVAEELSETRAEMTLPLKAREHIIGALDIQDTNPDAFIQEDITILQTMADQIALAVENIRLFRQVRSSMDEIQRAYGEYNEEAWIEANRKNQLTSYRYSRGLITAMQPGEQTDQLENKVSIPIAVRGLNVGAIEISKEISEEWAADELKLLQNVSEQLGIALDSARLFNDTQLRAATEQVIGKINTELWETLDLDAILKTTADNLRQSLNLPEVTIRLASPEQASGNGQSQTANPAE